MINLFSPSVGEDELSAIAKVFETKWLGRGNYEAQFRDQLRRHLGIDRDNLLLTTSCTEALFAIFQYLNLGNYDEVIVPSISFPAVASAIIEAGAVPVICDVCPMTANLNINNLKEAVTDKTRAIVVTHYGGVPCDMTEIVAYCNLKNIKVIEDSACALTASVNGKNCGTLGDFGVWSFDAMKLITTGDGGALYAKDKNDLSKLKEYLYLGLPEKEKSGLDSAKNGDEPGWWQYELNTAGRRAIMNDVAAAMGVVQMEKLGELIKSRENTVAMYDKQINNSKIERVYRVPNNSEACPYFYTVKCDRRDELAIHLKNSGIYTTFRYWPLHKISFIQTKCKVLTCSYSEIISQTFLNIPLHSNLTTREIADVIEAINSFK